MRLSVYIAERYNISRRNAKIYLKNGLISIDKSIITKDIDIVGNENIILDIDINNISYNIKDFLLYKSIDYIFLYKPPFMHSDRHSLTDSLTISDIFDNYPDYTPLSRLDYEADGVVGAINKNKKIDNISKSYYAIVSGNFYDKITLSNEINADNRKKVKVLNNNNGFTTNMKKIKYNGKYSLISVTLEKAARHQVRAFTSFLNYPILGDKLYGKEEFKRLCLHCYGYTINNLTIKCKNQTEDFLSLYETLN